MRLNRLGWWLAAIQVVIVLVVAAGMSWAAIRLPQNSLPWVAVVLAVLALLTGVLLGRLITVPAEELGVAAERLGQG